MYVCPTNYNTLGTWEIQIGICYFVTCFDISAGSTGNANGWIVVETFTVNKTQTNICGIDTSCIENGGKKIGLCLSSETYSYYYNTTGCKNVAVQISPPTGTTQFSILANWNSAPPSASNWTYKLSTFESSALSDNTVVTSICTEEVATLYIKVQCNPSGPGKILII
jgi:hypothetical protein